jgi:hypothetical protein
MTDAKFEEILSRPESSILDFKSELYDFANDRDNSNLAKLVKDVISFTNTIREAPAYIIFGIKELPDGTKDIVGIARTIDDAILQDKIKNKVYPLPKFGYSTKIYNDKTFGILEFPIIRYEFPITSTVKLKGVEIGKAYFRHGSSNTEALSLDIIKINSWLQSLPEIKTELSTQAKSSNILKRLLAQNERLSEILPEIYLFAKENNLSDLRNYCEFEIKGFDVNNTKIMDLLRNESEKYKYRAQTIKVSLAKIVHVYNITPEQMNQELNKLDNVYDILYFFREPITLIESFLNKTDGYMTVTMSVKDILPDYKKDYPVYGYMFNKNYINLYQNIRQKLIDLIMDLK